MSFKMGQNNFNCVESNNTIFDVSGRRQLQFVFDRLCSTSASTLFSNLAKRPLGIFLLLICLFISSFANGQKKRLFDSDEIFEVTLKGDLKTAFKDRSDDPKYYKATLNYQTDGATFDIPVRIKSRGNFRKSLAGCKYPPLFLNFKKSATPKASVFKGQDKTKLVTPCRGDQFVVNEYLVYKIYNLVTSQSFKARLVKVIYEDSVKNKSSDPSFGFLLEEQKQVAKRNSSKLVEIKKLAPEKTKKESFLEMAVFQYLIGNTDWSVQYQQNIILLKDELTSTPITIPYDFDHAGIVRAPYAKPAVELKLSSTLQRVYRGYCLQNMSEIAPVFEKYNKLKDDIYALYSDNSLLAESYRKQTLKFLDQFYETINDPKKAEIAFMYPCDKSGTGNVIIKGLNTK